MKKLTLLFVLAFIIQGLGYSQPCLPNGITFTSQEEINNFQTNHPNCTEIEGTVQIMGNDIINLNGLSVLTAIGGYLLINYNAALTSLTGLDNVTSIGGDLEIGYNAALTSLTGLDNVTSIGGTLGIGYNAALTSLTGLDNVTSIGGNLGIYENAALTSLTGLGNIDAATINNLFIFENTSLSTCEVKSVCDYIASPSGTIEINDNATGCNSQTEVEESCWVGISNLNFESEFSIYPNPATDKLIITSNNGLKIETVNIYNQLGQNVLQRNEIRENIDISTLGQGIYIIELTSSELKIRQKLIIKE